MSIACNYNEEEPEGGSPSPGHSASATVTLYSCAHQVVGWGLSVQLGLLACSPRSYQAQLLFP